MEEGCGTALVKGGGCISTSGGPMESGEDVDDDEDSAQRQCIGWIQVRRFILSNPLSPLPLHMLCMIRFQAFRLPQESEHPADCSSSVLSVTALDRDSSILPCFTAG